MLIPPRDRPEPMRVPRRRPPLPGLLLFLLLIVPSPLVAAGAPAGGCSGAPAPPVSRPADVVVYLAHAFVVARSSDGAIVACGKAGDEDAAVMNRALRAAGAHGTVVVAGGTYELERPVQLSLPGLALLGERRSATVLLLTGAADGAIVAGRVPEVLVGNRLGHFTLLLDRESSNDGIQLHRTRDARVEDVRVEGAREEGIVAYFSVNATLAGNILARCGGVTSAANPPIQLYGCTSCRVAGNTIDGHGTTSVAIVVTQGYGYTSVGSVVEGNRILNAGSSGIEITKGASGNTVRGNEIVAPAREGVRISAPAGLATAMNVVDENTIRDAGGVGISVTGPSNVVRGNVVDGAGLSGSASGIRVAWWSGSVIADNTVTGATRSGIEVVASRNVSLAGNTVEGNGASGIALRQGATGALVEDNVVRNNSRSAPGRYSGILLIGTSTAETTRNEVRGNTVEGGLHRYVVLLADGASSNTVTLNLLKHPRRPEPMDAEGENMVFANTLARVV